MTEYLWRVIFEGQVAFRKEGNVCKIASPLLNTGASFEDHDNAKVDVAVETALMEMGKYSLEDDCPGPAIMDWYLLQGLLIDQAMQLKLVAPHIPMPATRKKVCEILVKLLGEHIDTIPGISNKVKEALKKL